jgi:glycosyltransferase involved in cell wall biosynthesis
MGAKVSVIITNYNHERYLRQRIDSVLAQTFDDYSIVIYDDCSTDNSRDIIEQYRRHPKVERIVYNESNSGNLYKQWEKAIAEATGEWIWIAQSDDYCELDFLASLMDLSVQMENTGIVFCGSHWVDEGGEEGDDLSLYHASFARTGAEEIKHKLAMQCSVQNGSSAILRADVSKEAIKGISHYRVCGDWVFYERILYSSNIVYTAKRLNYFRWYHANVSNQAKAEGAWIWEGVDVIKNLDHSRVKFSKKEFLKVIKWWLWVVKNSDIKNKRKMYRVIGGVALKFFAG